MYPLLRLLPLFSFFLLTNILLAQDINPSTLSSRLLDQIEATPDAYHGIHIILADKVDVPAMDEEFYAKKATLKERTYKVITALQDKAKDTQPELIELLQQSNLVEKSSIHGFWIANVIFANVKTEMIGILSKHPAVEYIDLNGDIVLDDYERAEMEEEDLQPNGIEPGLAAINAPAMWEKGYTGYGRKAFILDTGGSVGHPALRQQYLGNHVPENQAWFDVNKNAPYDCDGHGTHVSGTTMGLDRQTNDTIGVAFNANWMATPQLGCSFHPDYPGQLLLVAAFQWAMNPDSSLHTIDDMPDAINNSWHDPRVENDCNSIYFLALNSLEAAGIAVVFSAGNAGPADSTITRPHNINLTLVNSFAVAAVNANNNDFLIADFSSRGPSLCGGEGSLLIKPEVAAPGFSVRSAYPGDTYNQLSGTSMAAPHTTGAILLLKEAFPELTGTELKLALYFTCSDLGEPGEDNTYGMGMINVEAAYDYLIGQGHTPADPSFYTDLMLIDLNTKPVHCEHMVTFDFLVENAGQDTITSFDWAGKITSESYETEEITSWEGVLLPGEQVKLTGTMDAMPPEGAYNLVIDLQAPNGEVDDRALNDVLKSKLVVSDRETFPVSVAGTDHTVCENTVALLRSDFVGNADIEWYDMAIGGDALGTGLTYLTAPLTETTTFYAEATYKETTGKITPNDGTTQLDSISGNIIFDAHLPFKLKTVTVYAEEKGGRIIRLTNALGELVGSKFVAISEPGEHQIDLNFNVAIGNNYRLGIKDGKPFYYSTSNINYPYGIENICTIKHSTFFISPLEDRYFYFYDWKVEYADYCNRAPVTVEVIGGDNAPTADFMASAETIDLAVTNEITFTNNSQNATDWYWEFGDGTTSTEEQPSHIFNIVGTYVVSLSTTNADGCTAFATTTIEVTDSTPVSGTKDILDLGDKIAIFPNPTTGLIQVQMDLDARNLETVHLYNSLGMRVKTLTLNRAAMPNFEVDLSEMGSGVYYLIFGLEKGNVVKKVLRQ